MSTNNKRWYILDFPDIKDRCKKVLEDETHLDNRFIYSLLLDYATAEGDKEEAIKILGHLKKIDKLRENFYQWRINRLE